MSGTLREYLQANLFDGDDHGTVTMSISNMLDDICNEVAHFFIEASGAADHVESYYLDPETPAQPTPSRKDEK